MHVALLTHRFPPIYNGPGRAAETLALGLSMMGVNSTILTLDISSEPFISTGGPLDVVKFGPRWFTKAAGKKISFITSLWFDLRSAIWLLLHGRKVDIVQLMTMPGNTFLPLIAVTKFLNKPFFARITMYGGDDLETIKKSRMGFLRMFWCSKLKGILSMTPELNQRGKSSQTTANVILLPKFIDIEKFKPLEKFRDVENLRCTTATKSSDYIILFVGSVDFRKGADLAIEAFGQIIQKIPSAKLIFVGPVHTKKQEDGSRFDEFLNQRIEDLKLNNAVIMKGMQQEVACYYQMADLFLFPSRNEGMPSALLEAMSSQLPTVICRQPWVTDDLAVDFKFGRVAAPNAQSIAEAVLSLYSNQEQAKELGKAGRRYVSDNHGIQAAVKRFHEIYKSAVEK